MVPIPSLFKVHDGGSGGSGGACGDSCATDTDDESFGRLIINRKAAAEHEDDDNNPCSEACIGSNLVPVGIGIRHNHMAEDDSRTSSLNEAGSSSKGGCGGGGSGSGGGGSGDALHQKQEEEPRDDEGSWLQLGIGSGGRPEPRLQDRLQLTGTRPPRGLFDLDLKPPGGGAAGGDGCGGGGGSSTMTELRAPFSPTAIRTPPPLLQPSFFFQHQHPSRAATTSLPRLIFPHQREFAWGYNRPNPNLLPWTPSSVPSSPSSSSATPSSSMLPGPYYARIFQHYTGSSLDVAGPGPGPRSSSDDIVRVIDAPPRPHSGVWFLLQASQNQAKEPFLPQIPKSFLRIKDGRMTVLLLMKYLVNKLSLDSESEVEIRCRGQPLPPLLTLQHVRDNIWSSNSSSPSSSSRDDAAPATTVTLLPDSSTTTIATTTTTTTTDHFVMILQYGRTA